MDPDAGIVQVNRHFKPLLRRAGLPDIRWHDLRHSCLTILLARGTHPKYVQHLAGHTSIQLFLDRYSHWMPSIGRSTASGGTRTGSGGATIRLWSPHPVGSSRHSLSLGAGSGRNHSETCAGCIISLPTSTTSQPLS